MNLEDRIVRAFNADQTLLDRPEALLYRVWLDCAPVSFKSLPMHNFMSRVISEEIEMPNPMTINRVRQQIQETHPEYHGKLRSKREEKAERIRQEINSSKFEEIS